MADHVAILKGSQGFQVWAETDEDGVVLVSGLGPGVYEARTPPNQVAGGFAGGLQESFDLERGEDRAIRFAIPDPNVPRYLRLVDSRTKSYVGWTARTQFVDWTPMESDGTVPIDLNQRGYTLRVHAPDGRRWRVPLPGDAKNGEVIELPGGDSVIHGTVKRADGTPLTGVAVIAAQGNTRITAAARTEPDGSFRLEGLEPKRYTLTLKTRPDDAFDGDSSNPIEHYRFQMLEPANESDELDLVLASVPRDLMVTGSVYPADGTAFSDILVSIHPLSTEGTLETRLPEEWSFHELDPDGTFSTKTLRGDRLRVQIYKDEELVRTEIRTVPAVGDLPPFNVVI